MNRFESATIFAAAVGRSRAYLPVDAQFDRENHPKNGDNRGFVYNSGSFTRIADFDPRMQLIAPTRFDGSFSAHRPKRRFAAHRAAKLLMLVSACWLAMASDASAEWLKRFKLMDDISMPGDYLGSSVATNGTVIIAGTTTSSAAGSGAHVYYASTGDVMTQLLASDEEAGDFFGRSVAVDANSYAIVGAPGDDDYGSSSGSAYVHNIFNQFEIFKLTASDAAANDNFGTSVGISGNVAIIGAPTKSSSTGAAYLFDIGTGQELFKLTPSDAELGDYFGSSVAISGNIAIVGAHLKDDAFANTGAAYLFDVMTGQQLFKLTASNAGLNDQFGHSVAIDGTRAIIGALDGNGDPGDFRGSAYLFDVTTGSQLMELTADGASLGDQFGYSVAIHGNTAVVGAPTSSAFLPSGGAAYVFDVDTGMQRAILFESDGGGGGFGDFFGQAVATDGRRVIVGASEDDETGVNDGAVFTFTEEREWIQTGAGYWSTPENWTDGIVPNSSDAKVLFSSNPFGIDTTVTVDIDVTVSRIIFESFNATYQIVGNDHAITLAGEATIDLKDQTYPEIHAPLAGNSGLNITGPGSTLRLGGNNTYSGNTNIDGALVIADSPTALGASQNVKVSSGRLEISPGNLAVLHGGVDLTLYNTIVDVSTQVSDHTLAADIDVSNFVAIRDNTTSYGELALEGNLTGVAWLSFQSVNLLGSNFVLQGDNSGFAGFLESINVNVHFDSPSADLPNGILYLHESMIARKSSIDFDQTVELGGLAGNPGSKLEACFSSGCSLAADVTYAIGGISSDLIPGGLEFAGDIIDTIGGYQVNVVKVGASTQIFSGTNTYSGTTTINDGKLIVNGTHSGGGAYTINSGGALGGSGTIEALVTNSGTLAPGNSPGITTIVGDYTQTAGGTLEIEVGGTTPGTLHDQLQITGEADLAGRLHVPIVEVPDEPVYVPQVEDEIVFLEAARGVDGEFDSILFSNLPVNVGFKLDYNATNVTLRFVAPEAIQFVSDDPIALWASNDTWEKNGVGTVPESENVLSVQNLIGTPQRVDVLTPFQSAHLLTVGDPTNDITVRVNAVELSVAAGTLIEKNGAIELFNSGTLTTQSVDVQAGGLLAGNGTIVTNTLVVSAGTIRPGFSVGHLVVQGDYEQGDQGTMLMDVEDVGNFDTINVTGEVQLDGSLIVDASNFASLAPGESFVIITAGTVAGEFADVTTVGKSGIYFFPEYGVSGQVALSNWFRGDMNRDALINDTDYRLFVLALMDPAQYFNECNCDDYGEAGGDFSGNGRLDFDDIAGFETQLGNLGLSPTGLAAAFKDYFVSVPEPSTGLLVVCGGSLVSTIRVRRLRRPRI